MKKKLLFTSIGVITTLVSVFLFYLFLNELNNGANYLLFIGSVLTLSAGIFGFIQATKPPPVVDEVIVPVTTDQEAASRIQANNKMVNDYNKTAKAREQLRMMQLAEDAKKTNVA